MTNKIKGSKAITLIALIITIIVLLILSGLIINSLIGENNIISKASMSVNEYNLKAATEEMELKIAKAKMQNYAESQTMPTLKELADIFCEDSDFEYVQETTQLSSLEKINNMNPTDIYTKLKKYSFEFQINSDLKIVNTLKIASSSPQNNDDNNTQVSVSTYDSWIRWLQIAGINNPEQYNNTEILENGELLDLLFANDNAIDYMLNSKYFIMPAVCSSDTAMQHIINNENVRSKLIQNSDWINKLLQLNILDRFDQVAITVPHMTSYTSPSGTVIYNGDIYDYRYAYNAFQSNSNLMELTGSSTTAGMYVGYIFPQENHLYKVTITNRHEYVNSTQFYKFKIQGSNDGETWVDLTEELTNGQVASGTSTYYLNYTGSYSQYRVLNTNSRSYQGVPRIGTVRVQFYCLEKINNSTSEMSQVSNIDTSNINDSWIRWLQIAGIENPEQYNNTNIVENEELLDILFSNENAIDYMLDSKNFIMVSVCSSNTACEHIKNTNYAKTKVFQDNDWINMLITKGTINKFENVVETVPHMTSYTSPSGTVIYSGNVYKSRYPYNAFQSNSNLMEITGSSTTAGMYVGYIFPKENHIYSVTITNRDDYVSSTQFYQFKVQGSNDGVNWVDLTGQLTNGQVASGTSTYRIKPNNFYSQYRLLNTNSRSYDGTPRIGATRVQFYCIKKAE